MKPKNTVRHKSYCFALSIIPICNKLINNKEYVISKQLCRSATSVGANIEEAQQAQSKRDFAHKISIALKEAVESNYWLRLLKDSGTLPTDEVDPLLGESLEIIKMLVSISKSTRTSLAE